jgi:putative phosphoserine phosphatase / 1-acylglycerol-3-phosphate O-acyltransferase
VRIRVGEPVDLELRSPDPDTRRIMAAIVALLPPEARERREPTPEELARSFPPGHHGDDGGEADRRPGDD